MQEDIIRQFRKVGASVSDDHSRIEVMLPSEQGRAEGRLISVFLGEHTLFNFIRIYSTEIPDAVANPVQSGRELKINYCARGRCELQLKSGGCTFLTAGEIAIDAGQAENSFYFPGAEYLGYEVVVRMEEEMIRGVEEKKGSAPEVLYTNIRKLDRPWIQKAGRFLDTFHEAFRYYAEENLGNDLLELKCSELMTYLAKFHYDRPQKSRTYYTASQVEIAKQAKSLICADLSVRYTARALAERFGVSETSVKNYFRSVYGCGFAEFQQKVRMEKAACLLRNTGDRISDIGISVGFASQPKFGAAFKACYGVTPLEYRRIKKLEDG